MPEATIVDTTPPSPPPAPTTVLHVDGSGAIDRGPAPTPPQTKKGGAWDKMRGDLQKKAGFTEAAAATAQPKTSSVARPGATEDQPPPEDSSVAPKDESTLPQDQQPGAAPSASTPAEKKKVSPWKLVEEYKQKLTKAESELLEARKAAPDPKAQEESKAALEKASKRLQELETEIRFVNYSKSQEFQDRFQKPYEDAWRKAMNELGELTMPDANGGERPISAQDMLALVNMPLKDARARAVELFGDFADDVMSHRKEIHNLFEAQQKALDDARKLGTQRDEQRQKAIAEWRERSQKEVNEVWTKANGEVLKDEKIAKFFKPLEGDEEGNKRLARGYELADKAFSGIDPRDPRLKPEQRAEIIQLHAAVRNRAAAYGRLQFWYDKAQTELTSLKAELAKYRNAEPGKGEGAKASVPANVSARDSIFAELRKRAH